MDINLVVGLGNPGQRYARTRHNIGFRCIDLLSARHSIAIAERRSEALLGKGEVGGAHVVLAKPQTYMNLSGRAVKGLLLWFKLNTNDLLVIYDDLDLALGRVRLRERGSAGGHRGVQSIIDVLGTNEFRRVRVGIGRPLDEDPIEFVLRPFLKEEEMTVEQACAKAADAVGCVLGEGMPAAMNRFNRA